MFCYSCDSFMPCDWIAPLGLGFGLGTLSVAVLLMGRVPYVTAEKPVINLGLQEKHMPRMQQPNPAYPTYPSFNMDQPQGRTIDINIGTNFSPMPKTQGNFLLVDPLPGNFRRRRRGALLCRVQFHRFDNI